MMTKEKRKAISFALEIVRTLCAIAAATLTAIWVLHQLGFHIFH